MKRRDFLAAAGALAATPALGQDDVVVVDRVECTGECGPDRPGGVTAKPAGFAWPTSGVRVNMETAQGRLVIELYPEQAPITAGNFLKLVDQKRFDGSTFYRAVHPEGNFDHGVVQGGIKYDAAKPVKAIAHEPTTKTGLSHADGALSMGRTAPGTAVSDFFICVGPQKSYDADPSQPGDNLGYAAFARVVEGMDVVHKILASPVSATKGAENGMKGQILEPPVRIVTARRAPAT